MDIDGYKWGFWNKESSLKALENVWGYDFQINGNSNYFRDYWVNKIIEETSLSIWNHSFNDLNKSLSNRKELSDRLQEDFLSSF